MRGGKNFNDLSGLKFGRLLVIKRSENYFYKDNKIRVKWICICE